eukprot:g1294.t1
MAPTVEHPDGEKEPQKEESADKDFTLEDDDGFEEFETGDVPEKDTLQGEAATLWEVDWDDEDVDIDFAEKLKTELNRMQQSAK